MYTISTPANLPIHVGESLTLKKQQLDGVIPYILSLQTVLGAIQLLNDLQPSFLILSHRFWTTIIFSSNIPTQLPLALLCTVIAAWIVKRDLRATIPTAIGLLAILVLNSETVLALASLILVISTLYLSRQFSKYVTGLLAILLIIETVSLINWLILVPLAISGPLQTIATLERDLYYLTAQINPLYMLVFSITCIGIIVSKLASNENEEEMFKINYRGDNKLTLALILTLFISILVAVYPYNPVINPNQANPGVDILHPYFEEYQHISENPFLLLATVDGSRPVFYLLLYLFEKATQLDSLTAIKMMPVMLNPFIVASVYLFAREASRDKTIATYAAFFTAAGYTISVVMYAYFLADLLALSIIFLSLASLIKALRENSPIYLGAAIALGSLFVFTHPWTFDQYIVALGGATLLFTYYHKRCEFSQQSKWLIYYIVALVTSNVSKTLLLRGSVEGVAALDLLFINLTTPTTFWLDLVNSSRFYLSGYLTNIPLLTLAVAGLIKMKNRNIPNLIQLSLVGATSSIYLVGNVIVKSRLLYNLPIGVLAAYGISYIDEQNMPTHLKTALKATLIVTMLSYLFRDLANLI